LRTNTILRAATPTFIPLKKPRGSSLPPSLGYGRLRSLIQRFFDHIPDFRRFESSAPRGDACKVQLVDQLRSRSHRHLVLDPDFDDRGVIFAIFDIMLTRFRIKYRLKI